MSPTILSISAKSGSTTASSLGLSLSLEGSARGMKLQASAGSRQVRRFTFDRTESVMLNDAPAMICPYWTF